MWLSQQILSHLRSLFQLMVFFLFILFFKATTGGLSPFSSMARGAWKAVFPPQRSSGTAGSCVRGTVCMKAVLFLQDTASSSCWGTSKAEHQEKKHVLRERAQFVSLGTCNSQWKKQKTFRLPWALSHMSQPSLTSV